MKWIVLFCAFAGLCFSTAHVSAKTAKELAGLEKQLQTATTNGDRPEVERITSVLLQELNTPYSSFEVHFMVARIASNFQIEALIAPMVENLDRSPYVGSTKSVSTEYPMTKALVSFGEKAIPPMVVALRTSISPMRQKLLVETLIGIRGVDGAILLLKNEVTQAHDANAKSVLQAELDYAEKHGSFSIFVLERVVPKLDRPAVNPSPEPAVAPISRAGLAMPNKSPSSAQNSQMPSNTFSVIGGIVAGIGVITVIWLLLRLRVHGVPKE